MVQLSHLKTKQKQELNALEIKLDRIYKENDSQRKAEQAEMLQKFINLKAELQQRQLVEQSKLDNALKIKNAASVIVWKIGDGLGGLGIHKLEYIQSVEILESDSY